MSTQPKTAIVTGSSQGIGAALVTAFLDRHYNVVANSRHITKANPFPASPALALVDGDIGDPKTAGKIADTALSRFGRIDVLINNAGIEQLTPVEEGLSPEFRHIFDVNVFGLIAGTLAVLPGMLARGSGIVVNVSSDSARAPEPGHGAYAASKAAVAAFTESVAHEVADRGVHVHVLYPAWVPTAMGMSGLDDGGSLPPKIVRRSESQVSDLVLSRMGGPRLEINAAVVPLLAPLGRSVAPIAYQKAMRHRAH
jgi:NAD(P)-dependent dehydrogenase (short-subunit alcohol dehydrogenase family)